VILAAAVSQLSLGSGDELLGVPKIPVMPEPVSFSV